MDSSGSLIDASGSLVSSIPLYIFPRLVVEIFLLCLKYDYIIPTRWGYIVSSDKRFIGNYEWSHRQARL
jgi:hypothetical protein